MSLYCGIQKLSPSQLPLKVCNTPIITADLREEELPWSQKSSINNFHHLYTCQLTMSWLLCGKAEDVGSIRVKGAFNQKHSNTHSFLSSVSHFSPFVQKTYDNNLHLHNAFCLKETPRICQSNICIYFIIYISSLTLGVGQLNRNLT